MPLYDYHCERCGVFTLRRTVQERDVTVICPYCRTKSPRVLAAPHLGLMSPARREAAARNEKSRHEPAVRMGHQCGTGCGGATSGSSAGARPRSRRIPRPWMLGH